MRSIIALVLCVAVSLIPACSETPSGLVVGTGTIHTSGVECNAWFLHADSGHAYELTRLPADFQHSDLRVRYILRKRSDLRSICMVACIAEVISMTKL